MKDIIKKAIGKALVEPIKQAREMSIFNDSGRIFLDATASLYGAAVNREGELIDANGKVMDEKHPDYQNIINAAKKQARAQSSIGSDLIGS